MITKENILEEIQSFINIDYLIKAIISNPIKKHKIFPKKLILKKL